MGMDFTQMLGSTIALLTLAGSLIGVYVTHEKKMAINKAEIDYLKADVIKIEHRVNELEDKLMGKVDIIMEKLNKIEIQIAKKSNL